MHNKFRYLMDTKRIQYKFIDFWYIVIAVFDIDGTLTPARKPMLPSMIECLEKVKATGVKIAVVTGSDYGKVCEQLTKEESDKMEYVFPENGCMYFKYGELFNSTSFLEKLGEDRYQELVNYCLHYIADLKIPRKRGTFIELRTGLLNVSPIGRNCTYDERLEFFEYDKTAKVRKTFGDSLLEKFNDFDLSYSIGGQISLDIFPTGWDKRFCLQYLVNDFDEIHFFGDRTGEGGNDREIYEDERTIGHNVTDPDDTLRQLTELFLQ